MVFIHKTGKDPAQPASYRPLTLLSHMGKVFERIIATCLVEHYNTYCPLDNRQFGFRKGIGCEQAAHRAIGRYREACRKYKFVAAISLDIKGAFDHAEWNAILKNLQKAAVPQYLYRCLATYLKDRWVECQGQSTMLERGCPQGSVVGPDLWNILYDMIICTLAEKYPNMCVYADDTLIIVGAHTKLELKKVVEECIMSTEGKLAEIGLLLNIAKTDILVRNQLCKRLQLLDNHTPLQFQVGQVQIRPKDTIIYLGLTLDPKLNFHQHITATVQKCLKRLPLLKSVCHNTYGYSCKARRVMVHGFIYSLLKYCSSMYYHQLKLNSNTKLIEKVQHRCNIMISRSYSDIPAQTAALLAAEPPLYLDIVKRSVLWLLNHRQLITYWGDLTPVRMKEENCYAIREGQPDATLPEVLHLWEEDTEKAWERNWQSHEKSAWTHKLFPTVKSRLQRPFQPNFWTSQAISAHGVFKAYLLKRMRTTDPECPCGSPEQTAEHVLKECRLFTDDRPLEWDNVTEKHLRYMEKVILELWRWENPNFRLRRHVRSTTPLQGGPA